MKRLNQKLITKLSLWGVGMGLITVWGLAGPYEGWVWGVVIVAAALQLARHGAQQLFLHGLIAGFAMSLAAQLLQALLFPIYMANNLSQSADFIQLPIDFPPRLFILLLAPFIAAASGVALGVAAQIAERALPHLDKAIARYKRKAAD